MSCRHFTWIYDVTACNRYSGPEISFFKSKSVASPLLTLLAVRTLSRSLSRPSDLSLRPSFPIPLCPLLTLPDSPLSAPHSARSLASNTAPGTHPLIPAINIGPAMWSGSRYFWSKLNFSPWHQCFVRSSRPEFVKRLLWLYFNSFLFLLLAAGYQTAWH